MKSRIFVLFISTLPLVAASRVHKSTADIETNLKAGAVSAFHQLHAQSLTANGGRATREARHQAYLLAEANEAVARQQILARLLAAKTPEEADAATAELHDRWLAARDSILALKAAAESEDAAPATPATD